MSDRDASLRQHLLELLEGGHAAWDRSVEAFFKDLQAMKDRVADPQSDLYEPFPWGKGQTLLREALLAADTTRTTSGR